MTAGYKINGIRINRHLVRLDPMGAGQGDQSSLMFFHHLSLNRKNLVLSVQGPFQPQQCVTGIMQEKYFNEDILPPGTVGLRKVCTVSIYPHDYNLSVLRDLFSFFETENGGFQLLVSSTSMLTFVVDHEQCDGLVAELARFFILPKSHTPFEQEDDEAQEVFIRKKYPEVRATYVESKIKTYKIEPVTGLTLNRYGLNADRASGTGRERLAVSGLKGRFRFVSAWMNDDRSGYVCMVSDDPEHRSDLFSSPVDMVTVQGPHFGDRHGIIHSALACLHRNDIPVLLSGCTGAIITLVLPDSSGEHAVKVLTGQVFDPP